MKIKFVAMLFSLMAGALSAETVRNYKDLPAAVHNGKAEVTREVTLTQPFTINEVALEPGSTVYFYEDGQAQGVKSSNSPKVKGLPLKPGSFLGFYGDSAIISNIVLAEDAIFEGIPLAANSEIQFHAGSGKKSSMTPGKNFEYQKWPIKAGEMINFYDNGVLDFATLSKDFMYKKMNLKAGTLVRFFASGNLNQAVLAKDNQIGDVVCKGSMTTSFTENGGIIGCTIAKDYRWKKVTFKKGTELMFHEGDTKKVHIAELPADQNIQGIECISQSAAKAAAKKKKSGGFEFGYAQHDVYFHANGIISQCILSKDQKIKGTNYPRGTKAQFSESGDIAGTN